MNETYESDAKLATAIRQGDYISYNTLFIRYYNKLCQFVYRMISDRQDSEDIVQELFLNLWDNRKKIIIEGNVSAYLHRMAKNLTLNYIRKSMHYNNVTIEKQTDIPIPYEDSKLETDELHNALYDCINQLPGRCKEVLLLHRVKGLKQKEIAEKLNISVKTIKNQIWISLQKLKSCLELKEI